MDSELTFPLALCKAQWSIGLHGLAMLETCGAHCLSLGARVLQDSSAQTRGNADAVARTGDWAALASAIAQAGALRRLPPEQALPAHTAQHAADTPPSRNEVVQDALHTLTAALNAHPVRRHRKSRAGPSRGTA
jgi:hypothetical protein